MEEDEKDVEIIEQPKKLVFFIVSICVMFGLVLIFLFYKNKKVTTTEKVVSHVGGTIENTYSNIGITLSTFVKEISKLPGRVKNILYHTLMSPFYLISMVVLAPYYFITFVLMKWVTMWFQ